MKEQYVNPDDLPEIVTKEEKQDNKDTLIIELKAQIYDLQRENEKLNLGLVNNSR